MLDTNVLGVHAAIQAFLPLLQSGHKKIVINISSVVGSLGISLQQVIPTYLHRVVAPDLRELISSVCFLQSSLFVAVSV